MATDLESKLLAAMADATSQNPVDTAKLYALGDPARVQEILLNLYRANKVGCCKITTRGVERIVWWPINYPTFSPVGHGRPNAARIGGAP